MNIHGAVYACILATSFSFAHNTESPEIDTYIDITRYEDDSAKFETTTDTITDYAESRRTDTPSVNYTVKEQADMQPIGNNPSIESELFDENKLIEKPLHKWSLSNFVIISFVLVGIIIFMLIRIVFH